MARILKIEESKIVEKNGMQMQRVIFSDDKIVYVRMRDGEVYPKNVAEIYVNLINTYNAAHDEVDSTKPKTRPEEFWNASKNYIKDGTGDRGRQIEKTKDKKHLSKNRETQNAINRVRDFGICLRIAGTLQLVLMVAIMIWIIVSRGEAGVNMDGVILCAINAVFGIIYDTLGQDISRLKMRPGGIRAAAITALVLGIIGLLLGGLGIMGVIIFIYSIIALVKIGRYEEWYYGEIE